MIGLINRLCEQGYELQNGQMDSFVKSEIESEIAVANAQRQIAQNPAAEPVVTILWSESPHLKDGQQMPLHEAEAVFKELDSARRHEREQPGYTGHWYDKCTMRGRRHGRRTRPSGMCCCMSSSRIWNCIAIWPLWSRKQASPAIRETLTPANRPLISTRF